MLQFPGLPWDNVEHYEKRSLLSVVKNVKTPTMVLTGESDYRTPCPIQNSTTRHSGSLASRVCWFAFLTNPHGIAVRPSHHMAKMLHVIGWFDRYRNAKQIAAAASGF